MPTKKYTPDEAWQALSDLEIEDDSKNIPVAIIRVPGIHNIKIGMLSEHNYYYVFLPMRNIFINHYANRIIKDENIKDNELLMNKLKSFQNDISEMKSKSESLTYLFSDVAIRREFFKNLKRMKLISWWVSWNRWQKKVSVLHTMTIFVFLWLFNVDGLKKNAKFLIDRTFQVMTTRLPTESKVFTDLDTFKKAMTASRKRMSLLSSNN